MLIKYIPANNHPVLKKTLSANDIHIVNSPENLIIKQEKNDSNTCNRLEESKQLTLTKYNSALPKQVTFKMI
jgi:hypothetical protein